MQIGAPCTYCKRPTEDRESLTGLAATRDHVTPRSKGGRTTVLACRLCNALKKDMALEDWKAFMESFPRWWEHLQFKDLGDLRAKKDRVYSGTGLFRPLVAGFEMSSGLL